MLFRFTVLGFSAEGCFISSSHLCAEFIPFNALTAQQRGTEDREEAGGGEEVASRDPGPWGSWDVERDPGDHTVFPEASGNVTVTFLFCESEQTLDSNWAV